ncbi:S41 family peptidase [Candidatus Nomurabacteria bacterium]|nr:S41 family peptidase [Candidatus Nomurabacteria bacterium]MCB9818247.1 S41 family peptidase [Candidatus Nomurabacteria bacterium]
MSFDPNSETISQKQKTPNRGLGYFLAFVLALGAFVSGLQLGRGEIVDNQTATVFSFFTNKTIAEEVSDKPSLDEFWNVWSLLEEKFVTGSTTEGITSEDKIRGAIEGLVDSYGDPYTVYMPPEDASAFNENISGNFSGVGMEVGLREGLITVISPLPETPAEKAGIIAGDVVVKIDDVSTEGMNIDEAVQLIRGEKGTVVTLQMYREGETEFLTIPVTRDTINIPTVKTEKIDNTFIVSLYSFNAVAEAQVNNALREYLESGADNLILDVRGNPGGFLQSAVSIASYFLPAGKVVVKEEFGGTEEDEVFRSRGRQIQIFNPKNLVVLVDNGSASASEILAGALKDHGVATVIGTQTFGKGSVQELVKLDDGSSLKVTVARWLTPNGTSISDGGLSPDITITRTPANRVAGEDPQKDAAVKFLKGEEVVSETFEEKVAENATSTGETE